MGVVSVTAMLVQNHRSVLNDFYGVTTSFTKATLKPGDIDARMLKIQLALEKRQFVRAQQLAEKLGSLPKNELHCSNLGADALHKAIMNYYERKEGRTKTTRGGKVEHMGFHEPECYCPYCEHELPNGSPYCANCGKPTLIKEKI